MQGEKNSKCEKHEKRQGKGNIPHYFLGILKVSGGRRSRCVREVLERVCQACQGEMVSADPSTCRHQRQRIGGVGRG